MYYRIARPQRRASTIIFGRFAVMRCIRGAWLCRSLSDANEVTYTTSHRYLMLQVGELRRHQLIEVHVRLYGFRTVKDEDGTLYHYQVLVLVWLIK
jgi:hypothetical protein